MFELPPGKYEKDLSKLRKYQPHFRYVLKKEFRRSNGPFADFIEKVADYIFSLIYKTKWNRTDEACVLQYDFDK